MKQFPSNFPTLVIQERILVDVTNRGNSIMTCFEVTNLGYNSFICDYSFRNDFLVWCLFDSINRRSLNNL